MCFRRWIMLAMLVLAASLGVLGCARFHVDDYINGPDKQYTRQLQAPIDEVYAAVKRVMERHGWYIQKEEDPADYERNEYTERVNEKRYLLITDVKEETILVDTAYVHWNIYLYQVGSWTDMEVRYEAVRSFVKDFRRYRNDPMVVSIMDEIEKEIGG